MPSLKLIGTVVCEWFSRERSPRMTEPDLVMDDPERVAAYVKAGRENGVMAPVYLYHAANICEVIRPGDTVVDLACGPANQLAMVARLNPDVNFIGVDLSQPMLDRADELIKHQGLRNVQLLRGNISTLTQFADASIDAVMSTMALHHLPDEETLARTYSEVARILKPGGGVYMVDFGHLKRARSIEYFANQYADRQPELFTEDYLNSLRAAFYLKDIRRATLPLKGRAKVYDTWGIPFMAAVKSPVRRQVDSALQQKLLEMARALPDWHKGDFADLKRHFKWHGMSCRALR